MQGGATFVGRDGELAALAGVLGRARDSQPGIALVEGVPGVGKTSLVRRALAAAPDVRVLDAAADAVETDVPWAVLDQLARAVGRSAVAEFGALATAADASAAGAWLLGVLDELASDHTVAIVVDDLPWSDALSAAALSFVLRRLRNDRVCAVFTARSSDLALVPPGIVQLVHGPGGAHIRLGGLSETETAQLADRFGVTVAAATLRRLVEETAGNPLHLAALLGETPAEVLAAGTDAPLPAPASFSALVLARVALCTPDAVALVLAAATLGLRCVPAHAASIAGIADPLPAIDEAARHDLLELVDTPSGRMLAFTHPMVRAAVYSDMGPARRAQLHRRAAELADDPWARLRHLAEAAPGADPALCEELVAHADDRMAHGPRGLAEAAAAFRLAANHASSARDREDYVLRAIECYVAVGDAAAASEYAASSTSFADCARLRFVTGSLQAISGDTGRAVTTLEAAWSAAHEEGKPRLARSAASQLATIMLNEGRFAETAEWAVRAGDHHGLSVMSDPMVAYCFALAATGQHEAALAVFPPASAFPATDPFAIVRELGHGVAYAWHDEPEIARRHVATAAELARHQGSFFLLLLALIYLGDTEYHLGRWDDAVHHAQLAVSTAADAGHAWFFALTNGNAVFPLAARGEWDAVDHHLAIARASEFTASFRLWAEHAAAHAALLRGDVAGAAEAMRHIEDEPVYRTHVLPLRPWRPLAAEIHLELGDVDGAAALLAPARREVAERGWPIAGVSVARVHAAVAAASGHTEEATDAYREAERLAATGPSPYERALVGVAFGAHLRRLGRRGDAAARLQGAIAVLERLGARPVLERAERELAACGLTPAKRTPDARADLTPQERTVAMLVARGLRTKEVAAELVVSAKTIEYHLGNVYRKLGISNRTQLASVFAAG